MATDLTLTSQAQVLALINADNAATVPVGGLLLTTHVTFGVPAVNAEGGGVGNTDLIVSSAINSGYVGDVEVNYNRLDLEGFTAFGPAEVIVTEEATLADVLTAFNALYSANLEMADVVNNALPEPDFDGENYTLVAAAGSLAYIGDIVVKLSVASTPLNTIITTTTLNGLEFPEA